MDWSIDFDIGKYPFEINHNDEIFMVGSCFSANISEKLKNYKFNVFDNPYGIIYNPISIFKSLDDSLTKTNPDKKLFIKKENIFLHYSYHSVIRGNSILDFKNKINEIQNKVREKLKRSKLLVITFGSSYTYIFKSNSTIVSNCHKQPNYLFEKSFIPSSEIINQFNNLQKKIIKINPKIKIIISVSPLRHLKDGIIENSVSKSNLIISSHYLKNSYSNVFYFPSFEIMNDELRDYRFYESDFIHPSKTAVKYIFEKFIKTLLDKNSLNIIIELEKLYKDLSHSPIIEKSLTYKNFLQNSLRKAEFLKNKIDVSNEIKKIKIKIKNI